MSNFERWLPLWVALCILVGILLGNAKPGLFDFPAQVKYASANLVVAGPDNFADWAAAGANGFGIGTALYRPADDAATVAAKAKTIVARYDEVYS